MKIYLYAFEDLRTYSQKDLKQLFSNILQGNCPSNYFNNDGGLNKVVEEKVIYVLDERDNIYALVLDVDREIAQRLKNIVNSATCLDAGGNRMHFVNIKNGFARVEKIDTREDREHEA